MDYEKNKDKPGAADIYLKIGKEMIDKEVNLFIESEKRLILYNEQINELKNKFFLFFIICNFIYYYF